MGCCGSSSCGDVPPIASRGLDGRRSTASNATPAKVSGFGPRNLIVENPGRIQELYDIGERIGKGSYGSVSCATKKGQQEARRFAVKTISKETRDLDHLKKEVAIMKIVDHPNLIKLDECFEDQRNIYLVMELCDGGQLLDRIGDAGHFTEVQAAIIMEQLFRSVRYMHEHQICHRDLKPENLLFKTKDPIEQCSLKIIDFGLSCKFERDQVLTTRAGTPHYVAPQVLAGRYDFMSDLWSCGVIMFVLLCGYPPFWAETDADVLSKVRLGNFSFSAAEWSNVSEDAKNVIRMLLKMNPLDRYTAEQALDHEWVKNKAPKTKQVNLSMGIADDLRSFRAQSQFKKAALHIIVGQLNDDQVKAQRETFMTLDTNGDGLLTAREMTEGLMQAGFEEMPEDLKQIVEDVDCHGGGVDCHNFLAATLDQRQYTQESVAWNAFKFFDRNGDGMISSAELKDVLGSVPGACETQAIEKLMEEVDRDGNGSIDFQEFMTMMRA